MYNVGNPNDFVEIIASKLCQGMDSHDDIFEESYASHIKKRLDR